MNPGMCPECPGGHVLLAGRRLFRSDSNASKEECCDRERLCLNSKLWPVRTPFFLPAIELCNSIHAACRVILQHKHVLYKLPSTFCAASLVPYAPFYAPSSKSSKLGRLNCRSLTMHSQRAHAQQWRNVPTLQQPCSHALHQAMCNSVEVCPASALLISQASCNCLTSFTLSSTFAFPSLRCKNPPFLHVGVSAMFSPNIFLHSGL
eukprot:1159798-Pelagomonas_calceolata.AAC.12